MGKGDIRTRRGKIWRRTYGVTRPRRWKTVVRPAAATRKAKTLKDLPKVVSDQHLQKPPLVPVVEVVKSIHQSPVEPKVEVTETTQPVVEKVASIVEQPVVEMPAKTEVKASAKKSKPSAKKAPAVKKAVAKKAPVKKKK